MNKRVIKTKMINLTEIQVDFLEDLLMEHVRNVDMDRDLFISYAEILKKLRGRKPDAVQEVNK